MSRKREQEVPPVVAVRKVFFVWIGNDFRVPLIHVRNLGNRMLVSARCGPETNSRRRSISLIETGSNSQSLGEQFIRTSPVDNTAVNLFDERLIYKEVKAK